MAQPVAPFKEDWFHQITAVHWGGALYVAFIDVTSIYNNGALGDPAYWVQAGTSTSFEVFAAKMFPDTVDPPTLQNVTDHDVFNKAPSTTLADAATVTKKGYWRLVLSHLRSQNNNTPAPLIQGTVGPFLYPRTVTETVNYYIAYVSTSWDLPGGGTVSGFFYSPPTLAANEAAYEAAIRASGAGLPNYSVSFSWSFDHSELIDTTYQYLDIVKLTVMKLDKEVWTSVAPTLTFTDPGVTGGGIVTFAVNFATDPPTVTGLSPS